MVQKKPDLQILTVWRIRLLLVALVPSFFFRLLRAPHQLGVVAFYRCLDGGFSLFYIFYYPINTASSPMASTAAACSSTAASSIRV